ncbi:hypothetical protein D5R40_26840 [Okeania hirsuta]|uniref:Uncharacterized protein n=1 Tax=Okeania hirsuta TaxID=1458930 RepID=A0A3N6PK50_9CYAN|nr:hypothetical protein D5R40_26840 [Okeania hirsuta]
MTKFLDYAKLLLLIGAILYYGPVISEGLSVVKSPPWKGGEPHLFQFRNGDLYLSWVEFSRFNRCLELWPAYKGIAGRSQELLEAWIGSSIGADFPFLANFPDAGSWPAHWLQKSAGGL